MYIYIHVYECTSKHWSHTTIQEQFGVSLSDIIICSNLRELSQVFAQICVHPRMAVAATVEYAQSAAKRAVSEFSVHAHIHA